MEVVFPLSIQETQKVSYEQNGAEICRPGESQVD